MAATVTLASTTLAQTISASDGEVKLSSTAGVVPGLRLYTDGEVMTVVSLGIDPWVKVQRGTDATAAVAHHGGSTVYIARGDQLYDRDPVGRPGETVLVKPHINVNSGRIWWPEGGEGMPGAELRWWQQQTTTFAAGPLGIIAQTVTPSTSS